MATVDHVTPDLDGTPVGNTKDLVDKLFEFLKYMSRHVWEFNNSHATEQASTHATDQASTHATEQATLLDEKQYYDCIYQKNAEWSQKK